MRTERFITAVRSQIADAHNLAVTIRLDRSRDRQAIASIKELGYDIE